MIQRTSVVGSPYPAGTRRRRFEPKACSIAVKAALPLRGFAEHAVERPCSGRAGARGPAVGRSTEAHVNLQLR